MTLAQCGTVCYLAKQSQVLLANMLGQQALGFSSVSCSACLSNVKQFAVVQIDQQSSVTPLHTQTIPHIRA